MSTTAATEDPLLLETWKLAEDTLAVAEGAEARAKAATDRITVLEGELKAAEAKLVTLEKVASAPQALDATRIDETLDSLQDLAVIDPRGREKFAAALAADPNYALDLMVRVAQLSQTAPESGGGLQKTASLRDASGKGSKDPDGWGNVVTGGA